PIQMACFGTTSKRSAGPVPGSGRGGTGIAAMFALGPRVARGVRATRGRRAVAAQGPCLNECGRKPSGLVRRRRLVLLQPILVHPVRDRTATGVDEAMFDVLVGLLTDLGLGGLVALLARGRFVALVGQPWLVLFSAGRDRLTLRG